MAVSSFVRTACHGTVTLLDGTGTPVELALAFDKGDLSLGEHGPKLNAVNVLQRRGRYLDAVHGEREFPVISFSAWLTDMSKASGGGTLLDFLKQRANYSANISTLGAYRPYAVDLRFDLEGSDLGLSDETCGATKCLPRLSWGEAMDGNSVSVNLQVLGELTGAWASAPAFS